jgi:hypothetical protein
MAPRNLRVQRLVTGNRCEELKCYEMALWYVQFESGTFHWCPRHLILRMEDKEFWEQLETRCARQLAEQERRP